MCTDYELDFTVLSRGITQERLDIIQHEAVDKFAWVSSLVDLLCFVQALSIPPSMYESMNPKDINSSASASFSSLLNFRTAIATIQVRSICFVVLFCFVLFCLFYFVFFNL